MKRIVFPVIIVALLIGSVGLSPVQAETDEPIRFMVLEEVDLYVDGSITPVLIDLTEDFDYVMRVVWNLFWTDNEIDFDVFGTLAVALTNGTEVLYNGTEQLSSAKAIKDFGSVSYDTRIDSDDKNPKDNHLYSRLSFWKFVDWDNGLDVHNYDLQFRVNDDITGACNDFFILVEGFKLIYPFTASKPFSVNPFAFFDEIALGIIDNIWAFGTIVLIVVVIIYLFKRMRS